MIREEGIQTLGEWFPLALGQWLMVAGGLIVAGVLFGWLICALRHGPVAGLRLVLTTFRSATADLLRMSPRRVWALSWLAVREAIRRRVVVVFAVFVIVLLFAGWFLDPGSTRPARLYLSFVLTATSYLVLLLASFLSALSLPTDIRNKTLHTVVTKPVRPSEIVAGRICGFAALGTFLLLVMAVISYFFVVRGLSHTHALTEADLQAVDEGAATAETTREGFTATVNRHRHQTTIDPSGKGRVAVEHNHWHELSVETSKKGVETYRLGRPRGALVARVPIYGKLRFKNRAGKDGAGVNVGDEWTYRSFIEGGTLATAIWTFDSVTPANFPREQSPNGIPLETTIEVFRTYKGNTDDPENIPGIPGSVWVANPLGGDILKLERELAAARQNKRSWRVEPLEQQIRQLRDRQAELPPPVEVKVFTAKDFVTQVVYLPYELQTPDGEKLDLLEDVALDGRIEIWLRCVQPGQFFGAAEPDLYLRARNASFTINFVKGYIGIWAQMLVVIGIGVMFSTFLSGPVTILATAGVVLGGLVRPYMAALGASQFLPKEAIERLGMEPVIGGGPIEALIRILLQLNMVTEMEPGLRTTVAQMIDGVLGFFLYVAAMVLPAFHQLEFSGFVANGFNISGGAILVGACRAAAYVLPMFVAGFLFLKLREVAK